jgi:uncharacterized protein
MRLRDTTRATTVGTQITIADTFLTRLIGLMGRKRLDAGCGLLIKPSAGIHTVGMRFPIDVVALNKNMVVLRLWPHVPPFRMTGINLRVHSMLELPPGQIEVCGIEIGDQLKFVWDS